MRVARELLSPLGAALALTAAALFFGRDTLPWVGGAAILLAACLVATRGIPPGWWQLLPLAGLAAWCAASIAWSIEPDRSWDYANRTVVYVAFALVGTYLAGRTRALALGLAALLGAVCVWSLAGKVVPAVYESYGVVARLSGPVGYWNALALLGDLALPLGLWLATRQRAAGVLLVYGWTVAIALTLSRGGIIVAALVVAGWLALTGLWRSGLSTLVAACIPAAGVIGLAFKLSGITSDGTSHATRVHDGAIFGVALVVGAAVAAGLSRIPPPEPVPAVRRMAIVLAIVAAAAACLVGGFHAKSWWDQFTSPATGGVTQGAGRLASASSNHRWIWWKEAWKGFRSDELKGTGAGSFNFTNLHYQTSSVETAIEPHDLPIQFLSETGVVGLLLFVAAMGALIYGARRPTDPEAALALMLPAYLLHGLIDFDWDFAAVSAPVFLVAGALAARPILKPRFSFSAGLVAAGVALAALSSFVCVWLGNRWANEAFAALGTNPAQAVKLAQKARSVEPLSIEPLEYEALAYELQGRKHLGEAYGALLKATRLQPENAEAWYFLGVFDLDIRTCPYLAYPALNRFTTLNPQNSDNYLYAEALAGVNSGKALC